MLVSGSLLSLAVSLDSIVCSDFSEVIDDYQMTCFVVVSVGMPLRDMCGVS